MQHRNITWHNATVTRDRREKLNGHYGVVIWFTGLSGSGKSTIAHTVEELLFQRGCHTYTFDGDNVRHGLCGDLGFTDRDRRENIRRIGEMVKLFMDAGVIALTAFISPHAKERDLVKRLVGGEKFIEVYCRCPIEICAQRDPKGLYHRARVGEIGEFTGISAPYEPPSEPALILDTDHLTIDQAAKQVFELLRQRRIIYENL